MILRQLLICLIKKEKTHFPKADVKQEKYLAVPVNGYALP